MINTLGLSARVWGRGESKAPRPLILSTRGETNIDAFITGSRAYGKPKKMSDVDLVVRMDAATKEKLLEFSDHKTKLIFGMLNIIACETDEQFAVWKLATAHMAMESRGGKQPFDRDEAMEELNKLRRLIKLPDGQDSEGGEREDEE